MANLATDLSKRLAELAIATVKRNTVEVQGKGNFEVFDELFSEEFIDHTPQPGFPADREAVRGLYKTLRTAFPDFRAEIGFQFSDGDRVTTYKTYYGTHDGIFMGTQPTGRKMKFETVDVMRVKDGKITEHWGVGDLLSLFQQLNLIPRFSLDSK